MNDINSPFLELLASHENVFLAWKKLRKYFVFGDIWFDEYEIAKFEMDLPKSIKSVCDNLRQAKFGTIIIKPLPHPKPGKDEIPQHNLEPETKTEAASTTNGIDATSSRISHIDKRSDVSICDQIPMLKEASEEIASQQNREIKMQLRQAFSIPVPIQVAWLAFMNIIGPELDSKMPKWSFGNRLYRSMWFKKDDEKDTSTLVHGSYNHTRGLAYKPFHQSWPVYRNAIRLTHRYMTDTFDDLSEREKTIDGEYEQDKLYYFNKLFWNSDKNNRKEVFWLALDFTKFYPSITRDNILASMRYALERKDCSLTPYCKTILDLAEKLLDFTLDARELSSEECGMMKIESGISQFHCLPTGLCSAHFLANVAMIPIDSEVDKLAKMERNTAHFRYVDDHVLLAYTPDQLFKRVVTYVKIVKKYLPGVVINFDKTEPPHWNTVFQDNEPEGWQKKYEKLMQSHPNFTTREWGFLDYRYPSPLLTQMLANVSAIGSLDLDLLDEEEQVHLVDELEALLMSDISEQEIRKSTRMSFAASRLTLLAKRMDQFNIYAYDLSMPGVFHDPEYRAKLEKAKQKWEEDNSRIKNRIRSLLLFMLDSQKMV